MVSKDKMTCIVLGCCNILLVLMILCEINFMYKDVRISGDKVDLKSVIQLIENGDITTGISRTQLEKYIGRPWMIYQIPYDKNHEESRQIDCCYIIDDLKFVATFDKDFKLVILDFDGRILVGDEKDIYHFQKKC